MTESKATIIVSMSK